MLVASMMAAISLQAQTERSDEYAGVSCMRSSSLIDIAKVQHFSPDSKLFCLSE
jgi:hypothetical protein